MLRFLHPSAEFLGCSCVDCNYFNEQTVTDYTGDNGLPELKTCAAVMFIVVCL